MLGRRVDISPHLYEVGDFGRWEGLWYGLPAPDMLACMGDGVTTHKVTEHEDGTITASPSILVRGGGEWHGYLERGIWREC